MNDAKEEIRARLNLEDLVSEYVDLKRTGRSLKGLSPWTNERTPSFVVSPDKQIWHDFSSGKGGDIFGFIMEVEGLSFRESLEFLARKTGVELKNYDSKKSAENAKIKKRLYDISSSAANFFQHCLVRDIKALEYVFKNRRISKEIVAEFKIGYAPAGRQVLVDYLLNKGYSKKEINMAGLLNRFGGDIFNDRMMIPLQDQNGETIGFTGRALKDEPNSPKYLNSPQTMLYDKSRHIFGLSQAKQSIRKNNYTVVVEGNMDVISSHQVGVKNVVATAGTAMTTDHLKAISRYSSDIRLCFDADVAGVNATERAIILAQSVGVDISIITLDQSQGAAKDPDELIQKSVDLWQKSIDNPLPAVDWVLGQYANKNDLSTAIGKRNFSTAGLKLVQNLSDPVEKEHYLDEISNKIGSSRQALLAKFIDEKPAPRPKKQAKIDKSAPNNFANEFGYEDDLLALALIFADSSQYIKNLDQNSLNSDEKNQILRVLQQNQREELKKNENYVKILLLKADERYDGWKNKEVINEIKRLVQKVKIQNITKQKEDLQDQLKDAEIQGEDGLARDILLKITELNKEINSGKN